MKRSRILLGAGWKMNKTVRQAEDYAQRLLPLIDGMSGIEDIQLFVVPPFTAIGAVKRLLDGRLWVGAQNMHWEEQGAYTGEISAPMLKELGVDLVELGHAERRHYFNETDEAVRRKVQMALDYELRPLVCIGEQFQDRECGVEKEAITRQLRIGLGSVPHDCAANVMLAYEPVWAIGDEGTTATAPDVRIMIGHIRHVLADMFGERAAAVPVLYGGTVDEDNCGELLLDGQCDGLFVGRAAWRAEGFARLIQASALALRAGRTTAAQLK
jgi:triosephosphate isomerase